MKVKKSLYPKTTRVTGEEEKTVITEKLDGSNLGFFVFEDELYIAQRNWVFKYKTLADYKDDLYRGLYAWLEENGDELLKDLRNNSAIFGEWIGMGRIKYTDTDINERFYMFAKANIKNNEFELSNLYYDHGLFHYPFHSLKIPHYIKTVPIVAKLGNFPSIAELDDIYTDYCTQVGRSVEGFVASTGVKVLKYVRNKAGVISEHMTPEAREVKLKEQRRSKK